MHINGINLLQISIFRTMMARRPCATVGGQSDSQQQTQESQIMSPRDERLQV